MSSNGHRATAAALAAGGLMAMSPTTAGLLFAAGCLAGGRAPDWLEIVWFRRGRQSLIPHRTLTHWPAPWLLGLAFVALLPPAPHISHFGAGFLAGGLLHLITDLATPSGIPLLHPYGRRFSLNLYRTGGPGEAGIVILAWAWPATSLLRGFF